MSLHCTLLISVREFISGGFKIPGVREDAVDVVLIVVVVRVSKLFCPETLSMKSERKSIKLKK